MRNILLIIINLLMIIIINHINLFTLYHTHYFIKYFMFKFDNFYNVLIFYNILKYSIFQTTFIHYI